MWGFGNATRQSARRRALPQKSLASGSQKYGGRYLVDVLLPDGWPSAKRASTDRASLGGRPAHGSLPRRLWLVSYRRRASGRGATALSTGARPRSWRTGIALPLGVGLGPSRSITRSSGISRAVLERISVVHPR